MFRFIRLPILTLALCGIGSAAPISMNSSATFTGGLDLAIDSPDNDSVTRLSSTLNAASSTFNLVSVGDVDWLALGTLRLGEGISIGDTTPNIIPGEYDDGYQLGVNVDLNVGLFSFIANNALFTTNFDSGATDADTTDAPSELSVDFSSLSQNVTVGLITYSLSIVDNQFSNNSVLSFNQNATAATVWLRAEVLLVDDPNTGEVPEVGAMAMMGSGLMAVGLLARRRKTARPLEPKLA